MLVEIQIQCENHILRTENTVKVTSSHTSFFLRQALSILPRLVLNGQTQGKCQSLILTVLGLYTVRALHNCITIPNSEKGS